MLDYPPLSRSALFEVHASKASLESPNEWLSRGLYLRVFAHTRTEIWRLEMSLSRGPLFAF